MTGKPSAFGKQLLHIICPGSRPLTNCHCARMVYGFWEAQLSAPIKTKLAGKKFNKDTYQELFKLADEAYLANHGSSSTPAVVAAVSKPQSDGSSSSEPAQVSAVSRGRGRGGRGNRGGRGRGNNTWRGNSNNQSQNSSQNSSNPPTQTGTKPHQRGPKHSDLPASAAWACAQHWKKGRGAPYCSDPLVCEWSQVVAPRTPATSS